MPLLENYKDLLNNLEELNFEKLYKLYACNDNIEEYPLKTSEFNFENNNKDHYTIEIINKIYVFKDAGSVIAFELPVRMAVGFNQDKGVFGIASIGEYNWLLEKTEQNIKDVFIELYNATDYIQLKTDLIDSFIELINKA